MVTTRALARRRTAQSTKQDGDCFSPFLDLPKELRLLIISFVYEEEPPKFGFDDCDPMLLSRGPIDSSTEISECPALFTVCRLLSKESRPIFYSSMAFLFNLVCASDKTYKRLKGKIRKNPRYLKNSRRVTISGRKHVGRPSITFDLERLEIVDARWRPLRSRSDGFSSRLLPPVHYHLCATELIGFQRALEQVQSAAPVPLHGATKKEAHTVSALLAVLKAASGPFYFGPKLVGAIARKTGETPETSGVCDCVDLVVPSTPPKIATKSES